MKYKGHTKKDLTDIYELMQLSRKLDDKQLIMLKQGKGFFHIGASGHEAVEVAAAKSSLAATPIQVSQVQLS